MEKALLEGEKGRPKEGKRDAEKGKEVAKGGGVKTCNDLRQRTFLKFFFPSLVLRFSFCFAPAAAVTDSEPSSKKL